MKKALSLISSGIDSPVATYLMTKKGLGVDCIHFDNTPYLDRGSKDIVKRQLKNLAEVLNKKICLYIINHGKNLKEFQEKLNYRYTCVFCKRIMLRIAEKIAKEKEYDFLITGENLGQVASQTLDNMAATDNAVKLPVLRPLLTMDKQEIIDLAKEIGTFDISTEKSVCCKAVPQSPITKAKLELVKIEENKIDVENHINSAFESMETIEIIP